MEIRSERPIYQFGEFLLDPAHRSLSRRNGEPIPVRDKVLDTLIYLVENAGRPVGKDELLEAVWPGVIVDENNLNQAISNLRRILKDERHAPKFVATLVGRGYQFVGDVAIVHTSPAAAAPMAGTGEQHPVSWRPSALGVIAAAAVLAVAAALLLGTDPARYSPQAGEGRLVTDFPGNHRDPAFRADGSMMAFASDASGDWQIWVQSLAGGAPVQITRDAGSAHRPNWSPHSDVIVFGRALRGEAPAIWSVDPLGTTAPRLLIERGVSPGLSDDGASIVYADAGGDGIWRARADGTAPRRVPGTPRMEEPAIAAPALSPDGRHIAYFAHSVGPLGDLWVIPTGGGEPRRLTLEDARVRSPTWTPDGRFVIYVSARGGTPNLWAVPFTGGEPRPVTIGAGEHGQPAVAPDGGRLLYTDRRTRWSLMRTDPDTGVHQALLERRYSLYIPQVSPDGRHIAYFSELPSGNHVFTVAIDGTDVRQLTTGEGDLNICPIWSADGDSLLIYQEKPSASLRRQPLGGGPSVEVLAGFRYATHHSARERPQGDAVVYVRMEPPGSGRPTRTIVRDLKSGAETVLPLPAVGWPTWTRDGEQVLGARRDSGEIVLCAVAEGTCEVLAQTGAPVEAEHPRGFHPRWSADETRIFYLRFSGTAAATTELWVVDRDGGHQRKLVDLAPRDVVDPRFEVTPDDQIVWSRVERSSYAIWVAELE